MGATAHDEIPADCTGYGCEFGTAAERLRHLGEAVHKHTVLRRHCDEAGRDYGAITRTATTMVIIRDTEEEARALVPPGSEFAYPGDLGQVARS